jgi:hypothetical protein
MALSAADSRESFGGWAISDEDRPAAREVARAAADPVATERV